LRAIQEGIVFSFMYGIEIMKQMGMEIRTIRAGNTNMFQSEVFRQTLATVSGATIELYNTDGAAGAARGAAVGSGFYKSFDEAFRCLEKTNTIFPEQSNSQITDAWEKWKHVLENTLNNKQNK
jgi:xylulokinase